MTRHLTIAPSTANLDETEDDLVKEFVAQAEVGDATKRRYAVQLAEFRRWLAHPSARRKLRSASLLDAGRADVVRFMAYLKSGDRFASTGDVRSRDTLSASTRKAYLATLHRLYDYLISVEMVDANPTAGVPRPKVRITPGLHLSADELRRLLEAPGTPRDRVQVYLLAFTAARVNEIRCLRWRDVNFTDSTMTLHGKGDKYRIIDIHPRLMPELRRWRLRQDTIAERDPALRQMRENPETDFVLVTTRGKQLAPSAIFKQLKRRASRAGLYALEPAHREHRSEISPHALRRTFATLLLNDGHHIDAVADVLGHSSIDTTRKHYAFSSNARRKATIEAFDV